MSYTDVTSAMGWSGRYGHCPCCRKDCKLVHLAPCVNDEHCEAER